MAGAKTSHPAAARRGAGRHQGAEAVLRDLRRREMENHFECRWDLFRSIPSLEVEGAPAALALVTLAAVHWFHECWLGDHAACSRHPSRDCRLRGRCSGGKAGSGDEQLCTRYRASWPVRRGQGAVGQDDDFRRGTTGRALARQPGITWPGHSAHPRRRQDVPTGLVRAIPAGRQAEFGAAGATRTLAWAIAGSTENKLPDSHERHRLAIQSETARAGVCWRRPVTS